MNQALNNTSNGPYPLLEGGVAAPIKKCNATLELGAAGEVKRLLQQAIDLPRHAEAQVALHLFDRRVDPSFKEGIVQCPFLVLFTSSTAPRLPLGKATKTREHSVFFRTLHRQLNWNWR